jgi:hypothetical protein
MPRVSALTIVLAIAVAVAACGRFTRDVRLVSDPRATVDELWQEPSDIAGRDLYYGVGGRQLSPGNAAFGFVSRDTNGWSPGFDVRSEDGREWSVKLGPEAQSEVVASRILWAIGFHQPPTYYLAEWTMTGAISGPQPPGRFRPSGLGAVVGDWSWYENPFVGTRAFAGLVVANLLLNNWDWKTSNNKVYELAGPVNGVRRWFVVRDVGASLGRTTYPALLTWVRLRGFGQGTRNDLPGFEQQEFIVRIDGDSRPVFDYRGIYRDVIETVTLADVRWTCTLLSRLSDTQWNDAFRAGGYNAEQTSRYVTKLKAKIAQGLRASAI